MQADEHRFDAAVATADAAAAAAAAAHAIAATSAATAAAAARPPGMVARAGDIILVALDGHFEPVKGIVWSCNEKQLEIEFDVDETRDLIERDSFDIVKVTRGLELREASERNMNFKRAEELLEWEDEHLSGSNKKKKGVFIYLPQPSREILPNPAEHPDLYDYLIIEIGSGGGSFALCIFKTGKGKVGVYTIDWDDRRFAHLKQDFRKLKWESLLCIFPKLIHVHFTWDCKANSSAGQQHELPCLFILHTKPTTRIIGHTAKVRSSRACTRTRNASRI